jgi:hypothetical protein
MSFGWTSWLILTILDLNSLQNPSASNMALIEPRLTGAVATARALVGKAAKQAVRPTVPVVLFVWGPGRILPVRVTSFSVEETLFSPSLHPIQATVTLGLEVLTPDVFKSQRDITTDIAVAAYNLARLQEDSLAVAHIANNREAIKGLSPF